VTFDVVVVGAGPAGTSTTLHLVRRERVAPERILVLDKARFPRDKPCAGAVSTFGLDVLGALGVTFRGPSVPLRGVRVIEGAAVGETAIDMGLCVRRTDFDAELLAAVRAHGVVVREGEGIAAIERTGRGFALRTTAGTHVTGRLVAVCDGAGSATRKLLGIREAERKGHLYVLDTDLRPTDDGVGRALVDFDLGVGLDGYYWDFPTVLAGGRGVSRGIYHANLRPARVKDVLTRALAARGIAIEDVKLRPFSTRPFVRASTTWQPGLVLVGEACGIDRTTGEGIAQAIDMGRIAARHLGEALLAQRDDFTAYDRALRASTTGRHLLESALLARWVYGRFGAPARDYLLASAYARRAAMRWYRGERLGWRTRLGLGLGLVSAPLRRSSSGAASGSSARRRGC